MAIIRVTMGGKIGVSSSGSDSELPFFTESRACSTAREMIRLPDVSATISSEPRIGTPERSSVENVREKRDSATFWNSGPNTGIFRKNQSIA